MEHNHFEWPFLYFYVLNIGPM